MALEPRWHSRCPHKPQASVERLAMQHEQAVAFATTTTTGAADGALD